MPVGPKETWGSGDERMVHLSVPPGEAMPLMHEALARIERMTVDEGFDHLTIEAKTPVNWRTYGEKIVVVASPAPGRSVVNIRSRPRWPLTAVDYGKGRLNVNEI